MVNKQTSKYDFYSENRTNLTESSLSVSTGCHKTGKSGLLTPGLQPHKCDSGSALGPGGRDPTWVHRQQLARSYEKGTTRQPRCFVQTQTQL